MDVKLIVKETWLSQPKHKHALAVSVALFLLMACITFCTLFGIAGFDEWIIATPNEVFRQHQYWRVWTTLFAHADLGHFLGNSVLFLPFSYFLCAYYSYWFFPVLAFFLGGIVNFIVLTTLPENTLLLGASGVVYWMGAAWLTLYILIERREPLRRRIGKIILIVTAIFLPETIRAEISYFSHFLGFIIGTLSGWLFFVFFKRNLRQAEVKELKIINDGILEEEWKHGASVP